MNPGTDRPAVGNGTSSATVLNPGAGQNWWAGRSVQARVPLSVSDDLRDEATGTGRYRGAC